MSRGELNDGDVNSPGEFPNGASLATAGWLVEHLGDSGIKIVDARYIVEMDEQGRLREVPGRDAFLESHIQGAVFLDLDVLRHADRPAHIVDADTFSGIVSELGIGNDDVVIVYDTDGGVWAARFWWALRLYGHESVKILDGGFTNWVQGALPVESGEPPIQVARFMALPRSESRLEIDDMVIAMSDPGTVIIDGLSEPFHTGSARLFPHLPGGHIPGAINMPAPDNLDPETDRLLSAAELTERWEPIVDGADRIVTYCGIGMYGAFDLFVLHLLGYDAALYDGSWEEWAANEDLPVATARSVPENERR